MKRILLVDDEEDMVFSLDVALSLAGYNTTVSYNGADALEKIIDSYEIGIPFTLVIADINMPGFNGLELVREIRRRGIDSPVIAMTGEGGFEIRQDLFRAGCDDYIEKPLDYDHLLARVEKFHSKSRARDSSIFSKNIAMADEAAREAQIRFRQMGKGDNSFYIKPNDLKVNVTCRQKSASNDGTKADYFSARNTKKGVEILIVKLAKPVAEDDPCLKEVIPPVEDKYSSFTQDGARLMGDLNQAFIHTWGHGPVAAALYILLDLTEGEGSIVCAGQNLTLHFDSKKNVAKKITAKGPALGSEANPEFISKRFRFSRSDRLLIHMGGDLEVQKSANVRSGRPLSPEEGLIRFIDTQEKMTLDMLVGMVWDNTANYYRKGKSGSAVLLAVEIPMEN